MAETKAKIKQRGNPKRKRDDGFTEKFAEFFRNKEYTAPRTSDNRPLYTKTVQKGVSIWFSYRCGNEKNESATILYGIDGKFSSISNEMNQVVVLESATEEMLNTFREIEAVRDECTRVYLAKLEAEKAEKLNAQKEDEIRKLQEEFNRKKEEIMAKYN